MDSVRAELNAKRMVMSIADDVEGGTDTRILPQLDFMGDQVAKIHAMVSDLTSRLRPILMLEDDTTMGAEAKMPEIRASEVSTKVDDLNAQLIEIQNRLTEVHRRVQL